MSGVAPDPLDRWNELRAPIVRALNLTPLVPPQADDDTVNVVNDAWAALHDMWKERDALVAVARAARYALDAMSSPDAPYSFFPPKDIYDTGMMTNARRELADALARLEDAR